MFHGCRRTVDWYGGTFSQINSGHQAPAANVGLLQRLAPSGCEQDGAPAIAGCFSTNMPGWFWWDCSTPLQSLNGLSQLSRLRKVQRQIGGAKASVGSLSESVRVFDPALLENLFQELWKSLPEAGRGVPGGLIPDELVRRLTAVDGTALRSLPQLVAFIGDGKWRLHLQFEIWRNVPTGATLTPDEVGGNADERSVLAKKLLAGRIYIMDRGYERYTLLQQIVAAHSDYVCRVQRRL